MTGDQICASMASFKLLVLTVPLAGCARLMCARADSDNSRFGGKKKVSIDSMSELHSSVAESFSLTQGGPLYRLQVRFGRARGERARILHRALFAMVVAWLPLLVLSIVQGAAYGKQPKPC